MSQIYKINHLILNNNNTQFCISYNNGIKTFSTDNFQEKYSSSTLGNISFSAILHELNMVIFVGSENNELYNNKKVVIYDLINQKDVYSTRFQNEITGIKIINKFLIISFNKKLTIFSLEKKDIIIPLKEIQIEYSELFEFWDCSENDIISLTKLYFAYETKKGINIESYIGNELNLGKKEEIKKPTSKIQNLFYIKKINQVLTPDDKAMYIYGINPDDGKQMLCLYRGKNPGYITSITLLNKNYLAVNNLNRTIHIFDISDNNNSYNISNMIGGFFYGSYISPVIRIPYDKIIKNKEGEFYESDFQKKGALLASDDEGIELKIIAYNGYAYKVRINFLKKDFEVILRETFAKFKVYENNESSATENDSGIYNYNPIFEQNKKEKKEEKFVVVE